MTTITMMALMTMHASVCQPYKRKSAAWLFKIIEDVIGLKNANFPPDKLTLRSTRTTASSSNANPGVGRLCRAGGHACDLAEARKAERCLKRHVNDPEDLDAEQKRREFAATRNKARKARRQAKKVSESVDA